MEAAHITALQSKHSGIEERLRAELSRPHPDEATVALLKRQKLKLKDAMAHH
ncbi:MAG: DUF465 domain-containing protein [Proteobacteria bacterium]|nr:DUF465 domain-containing protein [Pseudomonadota bacterium]